MCAKPVDILAVGNAIVDVFTQCDDAFLHANGIEKGGMILLDAAKAGSLYAAVAKMAPPQLISGGSAANTAVGVAVFGGVANFVGRVFDDDLGRAFKTDIIAAGVGFDQPPATNGSPTASSIILVTPDAARSMNTFLGASIEFEARDLAAADAANAKVIYLEGYLFDAPNGPAIFAESARLARQHGSKIALSLSDAWCVERHQAALSKFITDHVALLLGNEDEIITLAKSASENLDFDQSIDHLRGGVDELIVTRGAAGAVVCAGDDRVEVAAMPQGPVIDTTGAGDLFAAGYIFGRTSGQDIKNSASLASLAASEVITHIGARPQTDLTALADRCLKLA